jgi:hypothetical protein
MRTAHDVPLELLERHELVHADLGHEIHHGRSDRVEP